MMGEGLLIEGCGMKVELKEENWTKKIKRHLYLRPFPYSYEICM